MLLKSLDSFGCYLKIFLNKRIYTALIVFYSKTSIF
jgi:hypothetical protein